MIYVNGRPRKQAEAPCKKKIIQKTSHVEFFGKSYTDVTNVFTYSEEWESDQEYNKIRAIMQGFKERYF